ncbi:hypothetical protein MTYM_01486 [Methylococcales bacterium]|nr:hypothetical protein MTYM_01486 [Methylococcales bacterium]
MVMTKTRRAKRRAPVRVRTKDPMLFLEAMGAVTHGNTGLSATLDPYFNQVLGANYRARLEKVSVFELRERAAKYFNPNENISDLVIQMREE